MIGKRLVFVLEDEAIFSAVVSEPLEGAVNIFGLRESETEEFALRLEELCCR